MRRWALAVAAVLCASSAGIAVAAVRAEARERDALRSPLYTSPVQVAAVRQQTLELSRQEARLATEPTVRIGDNAGVEFGRLADVAPSRSGDTVYVLDEMEARVSAFDRGGRFLFDFGSRGSGPGEFRRPIALLVLPWSGEVGVWDLEAQLLTLHAPNGTSPRTIDPSPGHRLTSSRTVRRLAPYSDGFVVEVHEDPLVVGPERQHALLVRLDRAFATRDTLARVSIPGTKAYHVEAAVGSSATTWLNPPVYSPVLSWDLLADGSVLVAPGGPPDVYRLEAQGATRLRWRHRPERVTRRDRLRRLEGEIATGLFRAPPVPVTALEPLHRQFFSALRPSFTGVLAGPAGDVWVRHFDTRYSWEGHALTWERVARDGTPRPVIRMPEGFRPQRITGSLVYGVAVDPLGVERVAIYPLNEDTQKQ